MSLKQTIEVMGVSIAVESSHKDPAHAIKVAKYVEQVGKPIEKSVPGVTRESLAIMTALEIADQLMRVISGEKKAEKTVQKIISEIDEAKVKR